MRRGILSITLYAPLIAVLLLWGCGGGGPGSPGSIGTEDTGVIIDAIITPTYLGKDTYSVDVFQQVCQAGPPPVYEDFTDHGARVTIYTRLINPNPPIPPGTLYVEKYTVEFRRSSDSIGSPPIQSDTRYVTIVITPPKSGTGTNTLEYGGLILVDLKRKAQYQTDVLSGMYSSGPPAYINNYTATYTFEGQNQYGTRFSFKAQTNFQIGSFDYCS